jgi:hypothetical protein
MNNQDMKTTRWTSKLQKVAKWPMKEALAWIDLGCLDGLDKATLMGG